MFDSQGISLMALAAALLLAFAVAVGVQELRRPREMHKRRNDMFSSRRWLTFR